MDLILWTIIAYVLAQLAIGVIISRQIKTEDDYLIAGRKLGYGLTTFTIFATWFGAETCIGAAGAIYIRGLSGGTADPFGYALCILFMGLFFAAPVWKMRLTTIADLFRLRFANIVERTAVILMIPTSLLWAAAQIRAFGQVLSASSGIEVSMTITISAAIVIIYTLFGGLLADAWTDVIQGVVLIIGLIVLFVTIISHHGQSMLQSIQPDQLQIFGGPEISWLDVIEAWAIPVIGSVTAAELITRAIAARSHRVAQRSAFMAGGLYLGIGLIPVFIGLIGYSILPGLENPEQLLPMMAQKYLPAFVYALFAGALISAILSTVDSALLVSASLLSHNIIVPLKGNLSEREKVWLARGAVLGFGFLAYILALHAEGVYALVKEASAFGSAGIFTVVFFGVFTRWGGPNSAMAALLSGVLVWITAAYFTESAHPYLTSLACAAGAYTIMAVWERKPLRTYY